MFAPIPKDGIRLWNQSEIADMLDAVEMAQADLMQCVPDSDLGRGYRDGAKNTLRAIGAAFGLRMQSAADIDRMTP